MQRERSGRTQPLRASMHASADAQFARALDELKKATKYTYDDLRESFLVDARITDARLEIEVIPLSSVIVYNVRTPRERRVTFDTIEFQGCLTVPHHRHLHRTTRGYLSLTLSHVTLMAARAYGAEQLLCDIGVTEEDHSDPSAVRMICSVRLSHDESYTHRWLPTLHGLYQRTMPPIETFAKTLPVLGGQLVGSFCHDEIIARASREAVHNGQGFGVVYTFKWPWAGRKRNLATLEADVA
jgi:hypothetical protein